MLIQCLAHRKGAGGGQQTFPQGIRSQPQVRGNGVELLTAAQRRAGPLVHATPDAQRCPAGQQGGPSVLEAQSS